MLKLFVVEKWEGRNSVGGGRSRPRADEAREFNVPMGVLYCQQRWGPGGAANDN